MDILIKILSQYEINDLNQNESYDLEQGIRKLYRVLNILRADYLNIL